MILKDGNHAVATGNIVFMNLTVNEIAQAVSICLAIGYFIIYAVDKVKEWRRKDAKSDGEKT